MKHFWTGLLALGGSRMYCTTTNTKDNISGIYPKPTFIIMRASAEQIAVVPWAGSL